MENILNKVSKYSGDIISKIRQAGKVQIAIGSILTIWLGYNIAKNNGLLRKKKITGWHVFITGAGQGIGKQMAIHLSQLKCKLTLVDINMEALLKVKEYLNILGNDQVQSIQCDISKLEEIKQATKLAQEKFGDVDLLINNAGIVSGKKIQQVTEEQIQKTLYVNTISHLFLVKEFLPKMLNNNRGHIVTIASAAGHFGVSGLVDYSASKYGAVGFDESLRLELNSQKSNIKTTCICPFYINTGMFDGVKTRFPLLLPILDEKYVAKRIIYAILQDEKMVIMPWFLYLAVFAKSFLPVSITDCLVEILGVNKSMDHFRGRTQPVI